MKKIAVAIIVFLITSFAVPSTADDIVPPPSQAELHWQTLPYQDAIDNPGKLMIGMDFVASLNLATVPLFTAMKYISPTEPPQFNKFCAQLDSGCLDVKQPSGFGLGLFQLCSIAKVAPCVDSLEFQKPSGEWSAAELLREVDLTPSAAHLVDFANEQPFGLTKGSSKIDIQSHWGWDSNPTLDLPASASGPLVFKFAGRPNSTGEETYALQSTFQLSGSFLNGKTKFATDDFKISLRPIKAIVPCATSTPAASILWKNPKTGYVSQEGGGGGCVEAAYTAEKEAGWAASYGESFPIRLKVQLPAKLGGWFQGRVETPDISVSSLNSKTNEVTFIGSPTDVPITAKQLAIDDPANEELIKKTQPKTMKLKGKDVSALEYFKALQETTKGGTTNFTTFSKIASFEAWSSRLGEKARGQASIWSFSQFKTTQRCMGDKTQLQGLVTSNSMVYQERTPDFKDGFLTYKVAGLHLDSDGKVFRGSYNFTMRSTVARCLYGFSSAPISGTVSVTSASGEKQVATTSVTEKDGWISLTATGFTFSTPTVSVKLTQEGSPTVLTPPVKPVKKTTITCVSKKNSKVTKRVTAVAPKCPTGYKKK
jgi:hypothetical protein